MRGAVPGAHAAVDLMSIGTLMRIRKIVRKIVA
jgi:hypothetical protein